VRFTFHWTSESSSSVFSLINFHHKSLGMGNFLHRPVPGDAEIVTPSMKELTPKEVEIIQESWKIICAKAMDSGELIFYTFLKRFPEHQQKFAAFRDKPLAELKGTAAFRAHASRILNVFSSVIDALDKDAEMKGIKTIVADVGRTHLKRRISKKSQNDLRGVLVEILTSVCTLDAEGLTAWSKLLDIFFHIMFECLDGRSDQFY